MPENITRWVMLGLVALTTGVIYAIPSLAIPVLFPEIAADLDLTVLQLGLVWGSVSLTSMLIGILGGILSDRIGARRMIAYVCLLSGVIGGLRGMAPNFAVLVLTFLLYGLVAPGIVPSAHKVGGTFFPNQRGLAAGTISMGFALGLFIGSRYTASVISPMVGGWRNTLILFGVLQFVAGLIWLFAVPDRIMPTEAKQSTPMLEALQRVAKVRELWIIGIGALAFFGCYRSLIGYLPTYLRGIGWTGVEADNTTSLIFLSSLCFALPLSILSDRVGTRKPFLLMGALTMGVGTLLIGFNQTALIIAGTLIVGSMFDAFMGIHQAASIDLDGVGGLYAGSALGILVFLRELGGALAPPIGNALADISPNAPFFFWAILGIVGALSFLWLPQKTTTG